MKSLALLFLLYFCMFTMYSQSEIDESDYALKGVNQVQLTISILPKDYPSLGLTKSEVYENVSYLLRKDGLEVFSDEQPHIPTLNINFAIYEKDKSTCDINILVSLYQDVRIISNKVKTRGSTWSRMYDARNMSDKSQIQSSLEDICKAFINTLMAINPRR